MPAPNLPDQPIRPPWREPEPPNPSVVRVPCPVESTPTLCLRCGLWSPAYAQCDCYDVDSECDTPLMNDAA